MEGLTSSSSSHSDMGSRKRICILVFNDDFICQNLVSEVLKHCTYEVLHIGSIMDATSAIRRRKDSLSLVLTNMNRLKTKGAEIIQVIEKELNLSICYILPGNIEYDTRGEECNVSLYIANFSDINEMKGLWQSALEKEKAKKPSVENSIQNEASIDGETGNDQHDGETEESRERSGGGESRKKPRLSWNPEMHQKFVEAINKLGFEKAVPKKIVEYMNEPGLTREQVASHLQKYRMNMRRGQECSADFVYTRPLFYGNSYPSSQNFNLFGSTSSVFAKSLLGQSYNLQTNMSTTLPQQNMFPPNLNPNGFINRNNNMLPSAAIQNGHSSSGSVSSSTWDPRFRFVGFRVVNGELQFGEKTSLTSKEICTVSIQQQPANADTISLPIIQQESTSLSAPPAVIEINSFGGEDDISALLDATDLAANHPEGPWDDDDFNDVLSSL